MSEFGPRDEGWIERAPELSGEQLPQGGVDEGTLRDLGSTALRGAGVDQPQPEPEVGADAATQQALGATALQAAGVGVQDAAAEDALPSPEDPQAWAEFTGYQGADATPEPEAGAGPEAWAPDETLAIDHGAALPEPEGAGASAEPQPQPEPAQAEPPAPASEVDEAEAGL